MAKEIYIVTGATSFLGNNIIRILLSDLKNVRGLVLSGTPEDAIEGLNIDKYYGDITDKDSLRAIFSHSDNEKLIVIHCAGIVTIETKYNEKVWNVNVNGTKNIIELCQENNARMIYVSSSDSLTPTKQKEIIKEPEGLLVENNKTIYGNTKEAATNMMLNASKEGLDGIVVMPTALFGPNDFLKGIITTMLTMYNKKRRLPLIRGGNDFVDVRDVAKGIILACDKGRTGECYILSNRYITFDELINKMRKKQGFKEIKFFVSTPVAKLFGSFVEFFAKIIKKKPIFTKYTIECTCVETFYSHDKATNELAYTTRSIDETIIETIKDFKNRKLI